MAEVPHRCPLVLTEQERATLTRWSRRAKSAQVLAMRSRIILACAEGASNTDMATALNVHLSTVGKWRRRFLVERLDGLIDEQRPGRTPSIAVDKVEEVVVATLEQTPTQRHALVADVDGGKIGAVEVDDRPDLA